MQSITFNGNTLSLSDLRSFAQCAIDNGNANKPFFIPEVVLALLNELNDIVDLDAPTDFLSPNWENMNRVHEWKKYISEDMQTMWHTFNTEQKVAIAKNAQDQANLEEWD
jgi:hypothetical protein